MRETAFQRHFSDEVLLAYLDGEVRHTTERSVQKHLKVCWECRARLHEIDQQACEVVKALSDQSLIGPDRIANAKLRFLTWKRQFERTSPPQLRMLAGNSRWVVTAGFVVLAGLVIAATGLWLSRPSLKPREVLAASQQFEQRLYKSPLPVVQAFRIETLQVRPIERRHTAGRLEVWSESSGRRYAARWRAADGNLKLAFWRPSRGGEYVYRPRMTPKVFDTAAPVVTSLAQLADYGIAPEQVETAFMRWLESRQWRLISFLSDVGVFASHDEAMLRAERFRLRDGQQMLRIRAQYKRGRLTAIVAVEVEANTYRPHLQRIRFETEQQTVELSLVTERMEIISRGDVAPAVFEPEIALADVGHPLTLGPSLGPPGGKRPSLKRPPPLPAFDTSLALDQQLAAQYALHRVRACLGEPVEVIQDASGWTVVRGLVETGDRKHELLTVLSDLPFVKVNIQTADEALSRVLSGVPQARAEEERSAVSAHDRSSPLRSELEHYFQRLGGRKTEEVSARVTALSNQTVALSQVCLAHAWALRRLTEDLARKDITGLSASSKRLLQTMTFDHLEALRSTSGDLRALVEPALSPLRGHATDAPAAPQKLGWVDDLNHLLATVQRMEGLVLFLFASAGGSSAEPDQAVRDLFTAFAELERRLQLAGAEVAEGFPKPVQARRTQ